MKLWSFTFTNPKFAWVSMRVAAPTKEDAMEIVKDTVEYPASKYPLIVAHLGEGDMPAGVFHGIIRVGAPAS